MGKHNTVSILIPIYGVEKYIERCARSLLEQTYNDCEYVFVDDCTPDNSIAILEKMLEDYPTRKKQVNIVHHEHNRGLGAARLTGLNCSEGEYITFVDSDDYVSPDYVETMMHAMTKYNSDLVISSESYQMEDEKVLNVNEHLKQRLCRRTSCRIWGNLMKRSIMNKYQIFPVEAIDYAEDFHVMCRYISECEKIVSLNKKLYYYTIDNNESYTHNYSDDSYFSLLKSLKIVEDYLKKKQLDRYSKLINLCYLEYCKWLSCNSQTKKYADSFIKMMTGNRLSLLERVSLFFLSHHIVLPAKVVIHLLYNRI